MQVKFKYDTPQQIGFYEAKSGKRQTTKLDPQGKPIEEEWNIQNFSILAGTDRKGNGKWIPCVYSGRTVIDPKKPIMFTFVHDIASWIDRNTGKNRYKLQLKVIEFTQDMTVKAENKEQLTNIGEEEEKIDISKSLDF